jgi:hypothetical protein
MPAYYYYIYDTKLLMGEDNGYVHLWKKVKNKM